MATVLVVEDDVDISNAIREALTEEGWRVVVAGSAEEGMAAVRSGGIDVVLCDLLLQDGSDGRAFQARLATIGRRDLPFGFMTASTRDIRTLSGGYALQKPFGTDQLIKLLNGLLAERERRRPSPDASS